MPPPPPPMTVYSCLVPDTYRGYNYKIRGVVLQMPVSTRILLAEEV